MSGLKRSRLHDPPPNFTSKSTHCADYWVRGNVDLGWRFFGTSCSRDTLLGRRNASSACRSSSGSNHCPGRADGLSAPPRQSSQRGTGTSRSRFSTQIEPRPHTAFLKVHSRPIWPCGAHRSFGPLVRRVRFFKTNRRLAIYLGWHGR
jgi:hypothetical protein